MGKECKLGKSCGAACVSDWKKCKVHLPKFDKSFDQLSDRILSKGAVLNTPEAAVRWLESNKSRLASYGGGSWGDPKGDVLILAIEPGDNPQELYYDSNRKLLPRLEGLGADPVLKNDNWGDWYTRHPLVFANDIRQKYLVLQAGKVTNQEPEGTVNSAGYKVIGGSQADARADINYFRVKSFIDNPSKPFRRKLGLMVNGAGTSILGMNISPFGLPSDKYWPFENLPFKSDSVFKDRQAWLKYASDGAVKSINEALNTSPRKLVYVGANTKVHKSIFKEMAKEYGQPIETQTYTWNSERGNPQKAEVNMFSTTRNGNKTLIIQTNHPSWTGWPDPILKQINQSIKEKFDT